MKDVLLLVISLGAIMGLIGYCFGKWIKVNSEENIANIKEALHRLYEIKEDRNRMDRLQHDNVKLEYINGKLCNEIAKYIKDESAMRLILHKLNIEAAVRYNNY